MTSIIRRKVYTAVIEDKPFGALMVHDNAERMPIQIHLSQQELLELRDMIDETVAELVRRESPGKG